MEKELYAQLLEDEEQLLGLCREAFDAVDVPKTGTLDRGKLKSIMMEIAATYHTDMPQDEEVSKVLSLTASDKKKLSFTEFTEMVRKLIHTFLASEGS